MPDDAFDLPVGAEPETLRLALDGWEGPLDLLLTLARTQKVDLTQISILALVEQYLTFLAEARALKLEIAADYLVMAAWLAFLKSALLLPRDPEEEPSADELALRLQLRLERLAAMRDAGARLMGRDRIGRDVFLRRAPEGLRVVKKPAWEAGLYDLIAAYGAVKARNQPALHIVARRAVMTLDEALGLVARMIGQRLEWADLVSFLPHDLAPEHLRSAVASSFVAALELARQGRLALRQDMAFGPLMVRRA